MYKLIKGLFLGFIFSSCLTYAADEAIPDPFAQIRANQNPAVAASAGASLARSEEHTSELQSQR